MCLKDTNSSQSSFLLSRHPQTCTSPPAPKQATNKTTHNKPTPSHLCFRILLPFVAELLERAEYSVSSYSPAHSLCCLDSHSPLKLHFQRRPETSPTAQSKSIFSPSAVFLPPICSFSNLFHWSLHFIHHFHIVLPRDLSLIFLSF